jgi:hypothetical protein
MNLKRLSISVAILLVAQTVVSRSNLSAASSAASVTPVLRASAQLELTSTLSVPGSAAPTWSLDPQVGTVSAGGIFTAPSFITSVQTVVVTATSVSDSTQTGSIAITLRPTVTLSISPGQVSIFTAQTQQCIATLTGAIDPSVVWSLNPAVGNISATGLYTAPPSLSAPQVVAVTATSVADPDSSASSSITVNPVAVSMNPESAQLAASQSQEFTATLIGSLNTALTWTLAPAVGSIVNGHYTAPPTISATQTITVTATSAADPSKSASAAITLVPIVAVTMTPISASLSGGQSAQFSPTVTGTANTAVTWSLAPAIGTVVNGLYTGPAAITAQQYVTLTATSVADTTKSAIAAITLTPSQITLPIEVLGPNGYTAAVSFNIPGGANLSGLNLWMQIHGLRTQTQASLQLNNSGWQPISEANVTLLGQASAYGGIGGGFHTLQMTMPVPVGALQIGTNTLTFQFNQTDGRVSGFRVLAFNIQDSGGNSLISSNSFVEADPNTWQPPSINPSDIAAGQQLYQQASLTVPTSSGTTPIKAHCMDCHTQDGRDLKYFNYSNLSISYRSVFHGLSAQQGVQIASYIRSLNLPNPGRVWNPPYQPGPGLDSQPVTQWSAGAGLDAVLHSDADMLTAMFPTGVQPAFFSPSGHVNIRETQIAMQLPDWNSWLPMVHPMDAWPDFLASPLYAKYLSLRASLQTGSAAAYSGMGTDFDEWNGNYNQFIMTKDRVPLSAWTAPYINQVYSTPLWAVVKTWELNQEFGLEGLAQTVFINPNAESRAWKSEMPFLTSPNLLQIPRGSPVFENGRLSTWVYRAFIWYHLQLILNDSEYQQHGSSPIDWGYTYSKVADVSQNDSPQQGALFTLWQTKGLQISNNGYGPDNGNGWQWQVADISRSVTPGLRTIWTGMPLATRTAIYQGLVQAWLSEVTQFTPQQFYGSLYDGLVSASQVPAHSAPDSPNLVDRVWYMIPRFGYFGVNQTQINQLAAWAQTAWPNGGFAATATATCRPDSSAPTVIRCSTDN